MTDDDTGPSEASDLRNLLLHAQLDATLHEAGKSLLTAKRHADQQQATIDALMAAVAALERTIDRLNIAGSQALVQLEQAHQAIHRVDSWAALKAIAQAMEILANDD